MAGYGWHAAQVVYTWGFLDDAVKEKLGPEGLRRLLVGAFAPDLVKDKNRTHHYVPHPVHGDSYKIPNMKVVDELYFKPDAVQLGIELHLQYDVDHINNFLLVYGKPTIIDGKELFVNTTTGDALTCEQFFGNWKTGVYGQLYMLYDKFNADIVARIMPLLNRYFYTNFSNTKNGFRAFMQWLYPDGMPKTGIVEMDDRDETTNIHTILKNFFSGEGEGCTIKASADSLIAIVVDSAKKAAEKINKAFKN